MAIGPWQHRNVGNPTGDGILSIREMEYLIFLTFFVSFSDIFVGWETPTVWHLPSREFSMKKVEMSPTNVG